MERRIKIVLVDKLKLIIAGLTSFLAEEDDLELIGTATNEEELFNGLISWPVPDVIILDGDNNGEYNGYDIAQRLHREYPSIDVLALSMQTEGHFISAMIERGCKGYILKDSSMEEFLQAIRVVAKGEAYLKTEVQHTLLEHMSGARNQKNDLPTLSKREREILPHIMKGESTREIATHLSIGRTTVETHRRNLIDKYGARNTTDLVRIAAENNLLSIVNQSL